MLEGLTVTFGASAGSALLFSVDVYAQSHSQTEPAEAVIE